MRWLRTVGRSICFALVWAVFILPAVLSWLVVRLAWRLWPQERVAQPSRVRPWPVIRSQPFSLELDSRCVGFGSLDVALDEQGLEVLKEERLHTTRVITVGPPGDVRPGFNALRVRVGGVSLPTTFVHVIAAAGA